MGSRRSAERAKPIKRKVDMHRHSDIHADCFHSRGMHRSWFGFRMALQRTLVQPRGARMHFSKVSDRKSPPHLKGRGGWERKFGPCDGSSLTCQQRTGPHSENRGTLGNRRHVHVGKGKDVIMTCWENHMVKIVKGKACLFKDGKPLDCLATPPKERYINFVDADLLCLGKGKPGRPPLGYKEYMG